MSAATLEKRAATRAARKAQMEIPLDQIPDDDVRVGLDKRRKKYTKRHVDPRMGVAIQMLRFALTILEGL